jgi:hypothetical protein
MKAFEERPEQRREWELLPLQEYTLTHLLRQGGVPASWYATKRLLCSVDLPIIAINGNLLIALTAITGGQLSRDDVESYYNMDMMLTRPRTLVA